MQINILEYFEKTLKNFPDKTAVIDGDRRLSFAVLGNHAKILACLLISRLDKKISTPIGVFLPKSFESVFCDIGILYSGNAYMNMDVKSPVSRIINVISVIKPSVIISDNKHAAILENENPGLEIIRIDDIDFSGDYEPELIFKQIDKLIDTDPKCVINTSGSTGTPKGVVLNHKSFIDFMEWADDTFGFSGDERIGSLSPIVFDIYSFELCMLMAKAGTIVLLPESMAIFPVKILELLQKERVSFLFWVPTIMVNIANMELLGEINLPDLRLVWFAGEVFPTKQFNYWRGNLPRAKFANLYGPIEITLDCTYFIIDRELKDDEPIPIGYPCRNTDILILNDEDCPAAGGEEGELCVRGTSLAMGYYNNPEKTSAAFVQNPLNKSYPEIIYRTGDMVFRNALGEIVFKGRKDSLIKHYGYRIELGEIEHVTVNSLKLADNCCCVYNRAEKKITLFYEADDDISEAEFREILGTQLPKYMIPTVYIRLAEMPRNNNGKIDRLFLSNRVNEIG